MADIDFSFTKPTTADTVSAFLAAHNSNMDKILAAPFPFEYGTGDNGLSYIKFTNGTVLMWGAVDLGTTYICGPGQWTAGYISNYFVINFPVSLSNVKPTVIVDCETNLNPDIFVMTQTIDPAYFSGRFYASFDESQGTYGGINNKTVHIVVIGKWSD